jgi:hypothetical protein
MIGCLMPLSTLFHLYVEVSFIGEKNTGVRGETMSPVTDKLYHIMLYPVHLAKSGMQTHSIGGDRHQLHR